MATRRLSPAQKKGTWAAALVAAASILLGASEVNWQHINPIGQHPTQEDYNRLESRIDSLEKTGVLIHKIYEDVTYMRSRLDHLSDQKRTP